MSSKRIRPIYVGVGGTGAAIIEQLKHTLKERSEDDSPPLYFMAIDVESNEDKFQKRISELKNSYAVLGPANARLGLDRVLNLITEASDLRTMPTNEKIRRLIQDRLQYVHKTKESLIDEISAASDDAIDNIAHEILDEAEDNEDISNLSREELVAIINNTIKLTFDEMCENLSKDTTNNILNMWIGILSLLLSLISVVLAIIN
jgi:hypothetical protein